MLSGTETAFNWHVFTFLAIMQHNHGRNEAQGAQSAERQAVAKEVAAQLAAGQATYKLRAHVRFHQLLEACTMKSNQF